jgi:hypothetical protein
VADLINGIRGSSPQSVIGFMCEILKHFTERLRNDVLLRIATLDGVQPIALHELNDAMKRLLAGASGNVKKASMGGVRHAAEILNFVGQAAETAIVDNVREYDPDLAQKILDEMFVFENLLDIDDRASSCCCGDPVRFVDPRAQGRPARTARRLKNMSQRAARRCLGSDPRPRDRCAYPKSRANRRRSSRSPAAWPMRGRSCWAARAARIR